MKLQMENAVAFLKEQDVNACITGSCLLEYFEGADVDVFCYDEAAFTKLLFTLYHNKMFLLLDPLEKWKFEDWTTNPYKGSIKKLGLITIKFKYNMSIDVNVIFKEKQTSVFDVISNFDLDIISVAYDLKSKKTLNLSENFPNKTATWNKWNKNFYTSNIWSLNRLLRQFERVIKYYKRGYNTDEVALKYVSIIEDMINYENIFNSEKVDEKIESVKTNGKILIKIFNQWLEKHEISETELDLLRETIKKI
jgi:hypothetical protein